MRTITLLGCLAIWMLSGVATAQADTVEDRMQWFQDAKFGMFIHFGVNMKSEFNPIGFDAGHRVRIAKDAGMKYIVLTTKHHVGFCRWESELTDWSTLTLEIASDFTGTKPKVRAVMLTPVTHTR